MSETTEKIGSSRGAAVIGMLVTFCGGYVLGSMGRGDTAAEVDRKDRKRVPLGSSPVLGSAEALVTIVEFADFQCPYCARSVALQKRLAADFPGRVRWVFKHLPLSFHANARPAAAASLAAHAQGQFWAYHDRLFEHQDKLSERDLVAHAEALGLDLQRFQGDLERKAFDQALDADASLAKELGVEGTPNFFINGRPFEGALSYARLEQVVREELAVGQRLLRQGVRRDALYEELTQGGTRPSGGGAAKDRDNTASR